MKYSIIAFVLFIIFFQFKRVAYTNLPEENGYKINLDTSILKDRRILITAPSNYAPRLAKFIELEGGTPVLMPAIETRFNQDTDDLDRLLNSTAKYDWVFLPSRKAIDVFFKRVDELDIRMNNFNSLKFCAIGKDIEYLREQYDTEVEFYPEEASPQGIIESLLKFENINQQHLAVVAPKVIDLTEPDVIPDFIRNLQNSGISVEKIEGYITQPVDATKYPEKLRMIRTGQIDMIAFTSTAEIEACIKMLGNVQWINKNIVACFGPYTAANAKKLGVEVNYIGEKFNSFKDFVEGIKKYLRKTQD